jgi:hypothetical protein
MCKETTKTFITGEKGNYFVSIRTQPVFIPQPENQLEPDLDTTPQDIIEPVTDNIDTPRIGQWLDLVLGEDRIG